MKMRLSLVLLLSLLFPSSMGFSAPLHYPVLQDYLGNPQYPDDFWQVSSPEAEGMDGGKLRESLDFIKEKNLHVHSFLVIKNGKLVLEQYGSDYSPFQAYFQSLPPFVQSSDSVQQTPDVRHHLYSTTKTSTSALIGIAIADGKIPGVQTRVMSFFEKDNIENVDENKQILTIEDLLTMRSGLDFAEESDAGLFFFGPPKTALSVLNRPMWFAPGSD